VKSTVERLGPTKVKLSVEVPFDELTPSVDSAYKRIGRQVKVQGFRPGKVPPRILDQRVGRAAVLEEAVQEAIPQFYAQAVEANEVAVVSRPEVELDSFADGEPLVFSATVDVRPDIELPAYEGLPVTVDAVDVADDEVRQHLSSLQDRFAVLQTVDRAVTTGDYVLLDLSATADGEAVPGSEATGLSYEVGTGGLIEGLDDAVLGAAAGEARTFDAEIRFGEMTGKTATFTVTPTAVKVKDVPPLDDDFAKTASEYDTLAELEADVRSRVEQSRRLDQGVAARDKVLEVLLARADVALPESMVEVELEWRTRRLQEQLAAAGLTLEGFLESNGQTPEGLEAELRTGASESVKAQLLLDAIAVKEELSANEAELTDQVLRRAQRAGIDPSDYANRLVQQGQLGTLLAEIARGKALALVLEAAEITDSDGSKVDLSALRDDAPGTALLGGSAATDAALSGDDDDEEDHEGHDHDDHEGHHH
jgi:trigger factor